MKRREFIYTSSLNAVGLSLLSTRNNKTANKASPTLDARQYLKDILYTKEEIDDWFVGKAFPFSKYHSEFGWLLNNGSYCDGINGSKSVYTYAEEDGERLMTNYKEKPCRINTYGNSFTQCHQVSDHETWQEVLAAHLQEPVRNYGIGGWSVYQAYLRMLKEEQDNPADYIIFNIYEDDHLRNLDAWRNIRVRKHPQHIEATLPYVKVDLKNQTMEEFQNPCPTPQSFYKLCDLEQTYQLFKNDFVLKIMIAHRNSKELKPDQTSQAIKNLIKTHGIETRMDENITLSNVADTVHRKSALFSSKKIIEKIDQFAKKNDKKMLFVLSYPAGYIKKSLIIDQRWDLDIIDFLQAKNLSYIDLYQKHIDEFKQFKITIDDYLKRYFIGHYNPLGNFFCTHAIRDKLIDILSPKPIPYLP